MRSLKKNRDFRLVYRGGRHASGTLLALYARPNREPDNRLGVTAGKKVGGAVVRNRVKRWVKEAYRRLERETAAGYDLVFVARAAAGALKRPGAFAEINRSVRALLERLKLC